MYQNDVMIPMGEWAKTRLKNLSETDKVRDNSKLEAGLVKKIANWLNKDKVYPD